MEIDIDKFGWLLATESNISEHDVLPSYTFSLHRYTPFVNNSYICIARYNILHVVTDKMVFARVSSNRISKPHVTKFSVICVVSVRESNNVYSKFLSLQVDVYHAIEIYRSYGNVCIMSSDANTMHISISSVHQTLLYHRRISDITNFSITRHRLKQSNRMIISRTWLYKLYRMSVTKVMFKDCIFTWWKIENRVVVYTS